jgi:N-methylhydantoinase B
VEAEYPVEVLRYAIRDESGGNGRHRGGDGLVREYKVLCGGATLTAIFERGVIPPYGLFGGENGQPFRVTLSRGDQRIPLTGCQNLALELGDIVLIETAGGGGFGAPD